MLNPKGSLLLAILVLASMCVPPRTPAPVKFTRTAPDDRTSTTKRSDEGMRPKLGDAPAVIWREPKDIGTRDLFYGPGGKDHVPKGNLAFINEKMNGAFPKFDAQDESGVKWSVKLGVEAKPETAASRLVWAVGYFTKETYYVHELAVSSLKMRRGRNLIVDGKVRGVRLYRHNQGEQRVANWSWNSNPFVGTKELDGLKIMMELICNTDLKKSNQGVYDVNRQEQRYIAADLGVSFGKAGATGWPRSRGDLKDYQLLPLIKHAGPDYIDFWSFKHIPREHAKWIGRYLAQLSDKQISDAFRAAEFSPEEIEGFTRKVRDKINELNQL